MMTGKADKPNADNAPKHQIGLSALPGAGERTRPSGRKNVHVGPSLVPVSNTEAGGSPSTPGGDGRPHKNLTSPPASVVGI